MKVGIKNSIRLMVTSILLIGSIPLLSCTFLHLGSSYRVLETGVASWYGKKFQGRSTASGERFNMQEMTAAHRTLPFGTTVLVKSLSTGKVVRVKINDRGPFVDNRVIDLSYAAAEKLGIIEKGRDLVEVGFE